MAERNAAVHAAGRLPLEHGLRIRQVDLPPVAEPFRNGARGVLLALNFDETGDFTHGPLVRRSSEVARGFSPAFAGLKGLRHYEVRLKPDTT